MRCASLDQQALLAKSAEEVLLFGGHRVIQRNGMQGLAFIVREMLPVTPERTAEILVQAAQESRSLVGAQRQVAASKYPALRTQVPQGLRCQYQKERMPTGLGKDEGDICLWQGAAGPLRRFLHQGSRSPRPAVRLGVL